MTDCVYRVSGMCPVTGMGNFNRRSIIVIIQDKDKNDDRTDFIATDKTQIPFLLPCTFFVHQFFWIIIRLFLCLWLLFIILFNNNVPLDPPKVILLRVTQRPLILKKKQESYKKEYNVKSQQWIICESLWSVKWMTPEECLVWKKKKKKQKRLFQEPYNPRER